MSDDCSKRKTIIYKYTLSGKYICSYKSCVEAGKENYLYPRVIEKCTRGELKYAGEYQWRRVDINTPTTDIEPVNMNVKKYSSPIRVRKLSLSGEILEEYKSINLASKNNNVDNKGIRDCINHKQKTAGGYRWEKVE